MEYYKDVCGYKDTYAYLPSTILFIRSGYLFKTWRFEIRKIYYTFLLLKTMRRKLFLGKGRYCLLDQVKIARVELNYSSIKSSSSSTIVPSAARGASGRHL